MYSIGIRELRQHASRYLHDVADRGATIEVTDRGRPVARLVPVPRAGTLERLGADGRLSDASGDLLALGGPLPARPGALLPGVALEAIRANER